MFMSADGIKLQFELAASTEFPLLQDSVPKIRLL